MADTEAFTFSLLIIASTSDPVMKTMGFLAASVGHLLAGERLSTLVGVALYTGSSVDYWIIY